MASVESSPSLNTRVLVTAGIVLAVFLGAAGWILDQAFRDAATTSLRDRLHGRILMLLGLVELDLPAAKVMPIDPPDPTLQTPESGHYAQILDAGSKTIWRSRSMLGTAIPLPSARKVNQLLLEETRSTARERLFCLSYTILWEGRGGAPPVPYTVQVCEDQRSYLMQIRRFRRALWGWFAGIVVCLPLIQIAILRRGLRPLRKVASEVRNIESGQQVEITGTYPEELRALTENLNALIRTRDSNLQRYRNALGDLAHSLKTPLAVMRTTLESQASPGAATINEQLDQLDATINYQLQRAAAAGRGALTPPVEVAPVIERLSASLRKVYYARNLEIRAEIAPDTRFHGDQGDLLEIVGNVADNACKWARHTVTISVAAVRAMAAGPGLRITVRDDGTGIPSDQLHTVLARGARLDQSIAGHGIGLAVVRELVEDVYRGRLEIESSPAGTTVSIELKF